MSQVYDEPIVVRLTVPVGSYPVGTEFGFKDVADAIRALGSSAYFTVVRTQDGDPIPPPTPEDLTEAERQALARARAARLIRGGEFDKVVPGPGEVIVGTPDGPGAIPVDSIGGGGSHPVELPSIPGLIFHLDAQALGLNDGARISAWTDLVTGTKQAVQTTAGQQPLFQRSGINGRPAVYFDTARNDLLQASEVAGSSLTATVFVVATKATYTGGNRFLFGSSNTAKNIYQTPAGNVGIQAVANYDAPAVNGLPQIVAGIFDGATSAIRIDGVSTAGNTGDGTLAPTHFSIGHRISATAGQGFTGPIGEVLYFNRALSAGECAAVERYLSARWAIPVTPQTTWFIDSVYGNDANTGRSASAAIKTISRAFVGIRAAKAADATISVSAPESNPIREPNGVNLNAGGTLRLVSTVPGQKWHMRGSQRFTSGWTSAGGGVYSRPLALTDTTAPVALVATLLDADGQQTRIVAKNTATPTTPAQGQYGYSGGTYYLRLPGNADPNAHVIEIATATNLLSINTGTVVYGSDASLAGAQKVVVFASGPGEFAPGHVTFTDSDAWFSGGSGWGTATDNVGMTLTRCRAWYCDNDGFNHHATDGKSPVMEVVECEGFWNGDEGISPHEDTRLVLRGGSFHHNFHGGLTAVNNAVVQLADTEFYANRVHDPDLATRDRGGVSILDSARLISTNLYSHDNPGPGVEIETATGATWTDNGGTRSGTAHGNGAPDQV